MKPVMAQSAPIIPVNAKMYRHFAIATVLITGCLAMFASGENREALADTIESQQQKVEVQQAQKKLTPAKRSNFTDKRKVKGSFGSDEDMRWRPPSIARRSSGFAQTTEAELVAAPEFTSGGEDQAGPGSQTMAGPLPPGMSPSEYAQANNQKKKKKKPVQPSRKMSEQEVESMFAASDARSLTRSD